MTISFEQWYDSLNDRVNTLSKKDAMKMAFNSAKNLAEESANRWWIITVYNKKSNSTTELNKFGQLDNIIEDFNSEEDLVLVSARSEPV
jgi:hypothetical protein